MKVKSHKVRSAKVKSPTKNKHTKLNAIHQPKPKR